MKMLVINSILISLLGTWVCTFVKTIKLYTLNEHICCMQIYLNKVKKEKEKMTFTKYNRSGLELY